MMTRRDFLRSAAAAGVLVGMDGVVPAYAGPRRTAIDLTIGRHTLQFGGRAATAMAINGTVPGPLVRLRKGDDAAINVRNDLGDQTTSIHWHGIILPFRMDGVPGVSYAGIRPDETFPYHFPVRQYGTYWYHSHSAGQEQLGVYGPLIIDPLEPEPFRYDREYVVMLSDWLWMEPAKMLAKLKKLSNYSNYHRPTVGDFIRDASQQGLGAAIKTRAEWGRMRMDPSDIVDITGHDLSFLINGLTPESNWTALFRRGERVRLRFINAASVTFFDIRIPGLRMTVVAADGNYVKPVTVDEFRIGIAETYDVIVEPKNEDAYTIFAETIDRSGYARGTLAVREGLSAPIPERRKPPLRSMADMGMAMSGMAGMNGESASQSHDSMPGIKMGDINSMSSSGGEPHGPDKHGVENQSVAEMPQSRLHEPGVGLDDMPWRVLVYTDLQSLKPQYDTRIPEREIEIHATGNMQRYMWSFDGKKYSEATEPIHFYYGERLRWTWVNDTMMEHPLHLHGMWMELDNGRGAHKPRKHTIVLKPGERLSVEITPDAPGVWAFHCHILYHMEVGMFRVVSVTAKPEASKT